MHGKLLTALLLPTLLLAPQARADLDAAATRGSVGEIPNHYIAPPGLMIDVMNNDFLGGTDKYMTGAMKAGLLRVFPDDGRGYSSSFEFVVNWRALTPTATESVGGRRLQRVVGRFADWMESELAYARTYSVLGRRIKGQLSLGVGHIGAKGMRELHIAIHRAIGMQTSGLEYDSQPEGGTFKYDALVGDVMTFGDAQTMLAFGSARDQAMTELYLQANAVYPRQGNYRVGAEARVVRQIGSRIYDGIAAVRGEASVSFCIHEYYQPSFKYVSPYMADDPRGQFYAEVLRFNVPF